MTRDVSMPHHGSAWTKAARHGLAHAHRLRAPLAVSAATFALLAFPSPALEIYRTLALDGSARVITVTALCLVLMMVGLWTLCLALGRDAASGPFEHAISAVSAAFPAAGLALGLFRAGAQVRPIAVAQPAGVIDVGVAEALAQTSALPGVLGRAALLALLLAIGAAAAFFSLERFIRTALSLPLRLRHAVTAIAGLAALLCVAFALQPLRLPRAFGSIAIVLLFMLTLASLATALIRVRERWGVPALSCLVLLVFLLSWLNISDNHVPPTVPRPPEAKPVDATISAFVDWLAARKDRAAFEERQQPYPVFIISAQGGGLYSAHQTATFLARAQDRCPSFSQHVFAISAVSGGTVGAGVFAGLTKTYAQNGPWQDCKLGALGVGPFEAKAKAILHRDFLSPIVAAGLFGDLPHMALPFLRPGHDRARIFDLALEEAWSETLPGTPNPFKQPYLAFWDPTGPAPAVLANTTEVETGTRLVVTPFKSIDSPLQANALHQRARYITYKGTELVDEGWEALKPNQDIALSTAIGLSARFPWIMPAARFKTSKTEFRLVDGAYIDNSGNETVFDLIMELGQAVAVGGKLTDGRTIPKYQLQIITLTDDVAALSPPGAVEGLGELLSPIRAMLSSRPSRGEMAKHRVIAFINRKPVLALGTEGAFSFPTPWVELNHDEFKIPLTWQISEASRRLIAVQAGEAERCGFASIFEVVIPAPDTSEPQRRAFDHINGLMRDNNCVACSIPYRLMGRKPASRQPCGPAHGTAGDVK